MEQRFSQICKMVPARTEKSPDQRLPEECAKQEGIYDYSILFNYTHVSSAPCLTLLTVYSQFLKSVTLTLVSAIKAIPKFNRKWQCPCLNIVSNV